MDTQVIPYEQARRLLQVSSVLGENVLIATRLSGEEVMSGGFHYQLEVTSSVHEIPPASIVGTPIGFSLALEGGRERHFHGYVSEIATLGRLDAGQRSAYRIEVVPWLWFLGKTADCRIFQDKTVEDVLRELFRPLGSSARFAFKLRRPHRRHRFLVQYNETTLDFALRLLRREGIAFYVVHAEGEHMLHFVDEAEDLPELVPATLTLQAGHAGERLHAWRRTERLVSGRYAASSYNYKLPMAVQQTERAVPGRFAELPGALELERYHYSETFHDGDEGRSDIRVRQEQGVEGHEGVTGAASYRHLAAGHRFRVVQQPTGEWPDDGRTYTLTRVRLSAGNSGEPFGVHFEALPAGELAHVREVPTPIIPGPQTAVVTGPAGEEIHTDDLGRIKVQFHWDRRGGRDEHTTCWLRVMQSFAGPGFGAQFTPRIGQEVVVAFENGNPDRPFVLGALYHPEHRPPYAGEATRSGIRTRSSKGGDESSFNELRFEDRRGAEQLYVQAERDLKVLVKNDEKRTVGANQEIGVRGSATIKVGDTLTLHAGSKIELIVGGSRVMLSGGKVQIGSAVVDIDGAIELN